MKATPGDEGGACLVRSGLCPCPLCRAAVERVASASRVGITESRPLRRGCSLGCVHHCRTIEAMQANHGTPNEFDAAVDAAFDMVTEAEARAAKSKYRWDWIHTLCAEAVDNDTEV